MQVAKSLPSLSISRRMRLGFGGMLVLLGAVAAVGQLSVGKVHAQMRQITGVGAHKAQLVSGMRESVSAIGIQSRSAAMLNDIDPRQVPLTRDGSSDDNSGRPAAALPPRAGTCPERRPAGIPGAPQPSLPR